MARTVDTRERLIAAAEELFSTQGIEAVSLREIVRASGARNATALQYHFGDRAGLVRAVLEKHHLDVDARRHVLLDAYEEAGEDDLRVLAQALVEPLAAKLEPDDAAAARSGEPGRRARGLAAGAPYLQIMAELMNRPRPMLDPAVFDDPADSMFRWRELVAGLVSEEALRLHRRFVVLRFAVVELARRADTGPHTDDRLFVSHLVDLVTALLEAPLSESTSRLAATRDAARRVSARRPRSPSSPA
jgi:AcrR family transcriptional regulator